jgi:hypothetical protein
LDPMAAMPMTIGASGFKEDSVFSQQVNWEK